MAAGNVRTISGMSLDTVLMKTAATAVKEGDCLKTVTALAVTASGDAVDFIAASDIAASTFGAVYYDGVFNGKAAAAVDFAIGVVIYAKGAAGSDFDTGLVGNKSSGVTVQVEPPSAGRFNFMLQGFFHAAERTTHA